LKRNYKNDKLPQIGEQDTLIFEVKRINHRNIKSNYTVLEGHVKNRRVNKRVNTATIVGKFPFVLEKDEFEAEGIWIEHKIYGKQFKIFNSKKIYPETKKGIIEFLKRHVKGLGDKTATLIVDTLGEEALSKIEKDYTCLIGIGKIKEEKAKKIYNAITANKYFEELFLFIRSCGYNYEIALKIYEEFKDLSLKTITNNPYILCNIDGIDFTIADKIAKNLFFDYKKIERIKYAILYYIEIDMQSYGNLFIYKDDLLNNINPFLNTYSAYKDVYIEKEIIEQGLNELKSEQKIVIDKYEDSEVIYLTKYYYIENEIIKLLKNHLQATKMFVVKTEDIDDFINYYESKYSIKLASKQKEAIYMALQNGLSILTGGPGTGKTQTINAIIKCIEYIKKGAVIHLLAPTGRASRRIAEVTNKEAKTIHRAIGLNPYKESEINTLEGDIVIIDESSMIDAYVFYKLLKSIDYNTRILFVGDYEQLPSVGPGLILRDLINSGVIPVTKLDEIFRQSKQSNIVSNAHKIIKGIKTTDEDGLIFNDNRKKDFYFIRTNDITEIKSLILSKMQGLIDKKWFKLQNIQILTPMKKKDLGTDELNYLIQNTFNKKNENTQIELQNGKTFRIGDRVIQTINNYDLNVFNGEIGYIKFINDEEMKVTVEFEDKEVEYNEEELEQLELAYAITIHKSQGSEFPVVIIPIHESQQSMLNRNLIYTAVTRAKHMVLLIGSENALNKGIETVEQVKRNSQILYKLKKISLS